MTAPLTALTGILLSSFTIEGAELVSMAYSYVPHLHGARGDDQILRVDRVDDITGGDTAGLHRGQIEIHLDLALLSAVGIGDGCAFYSGQARAQKIGSDIAELLFGEALAGEAELQDRYAGGVVLNDERRRGAGR